MSAIVHLIGFPGAGKYTVALALRDAAAGTGHQVVVVDNHVTGNVILPVVDTADGTVPQVVWDRIGEVREVLYRSIHDLSPEDWSFVFTNVLVADDPGDAAVVDRLARLAQASGRTYIPVRILCDPEALARRVSSPERAARHKWTDAKAVRAFVEAHQVLIPAGHPAYDIDTTSTSPAAAGQAILGWMDGQGGPTR